jgi:hypothetical protein
MFPLSGKLLAKNAGLDPRRLNISDRSRTSRLPWRGQFSPELVEYLMEEVCHDSRSFLDPFCGSGTVLFEALARDCSAIGVEVNPAAWHLASLSEFAELGADAQREVIQFIRSIAAAFASEGGDLFQQEIAPAEFLERLKGAEIDAMLRRALAAALIVGMGDGPRLTRKAICRGAFSVLSVLDELVGHTGTASCALGDARQLEIADSSIEAVITSPPYINVFNYHQNYRPAIELLDWRPLEAAKSEIGSNRKHRMNRFLTVVQYCMDMTLGLSELARVLKADAPLVLVLGRESKVLGASFKNGSLIAEILSLSGSFEDIRAAERVFTNRFGDEIYEDIVIARRARFNPPNMEIARTVSVAALMNALSSVSDKNRSSLEDAIEQSKIVNPSPLLNITVPKIFTDDLRKREWKLFEPRRTAIS